MSRPSHSKSDPWLPRSPGLGQTPRAILAALRKYGPSTLAELAQCVDRNRETLRHHMERLADLRLVERADSEARGRGRPEVVYRLASESRRLFPRGEGEVLRELVEFLLERGDAELLESFFERRIQRKRALAKTRLEGLRGDRRLQAVAEFLTEEGFLTRVEADEDNGEGTSAAGTLRIVHCPLEGLIDATRMPCRVELDLVAELVGRSLSRLEFMPTGGASCSYAVAGADGEVVE